ncbi:MAG: polysaccharide biosynthesis tyrosine autokinase [Verrucomicrobiales bacterium]|nr:polysaccharide biosynthesis tyrosine autokinase [Verrucomicrobiales bacterium]
MNHHEQPFKDYQPLTPGGRGPHDFLRLFFRRFWIFLILCVGGYLLGTYVHSRTPPSFRSYATIEILRTNTEAADVGEEEKIRMNGAAQMLSASEKLKLPSLYEGVAKGHLFANRDGLVPKNFVAPWGKSWNPPRAQISDEALAGMMRGWVTVRWREETNLLDLVASHSDPKVARDTLVGLIAEYERSTESKLAGSSDYALEYILESSDRIKDEMLSLDRAIQLYNECLGLSNEIRNLENVIAEMEKRYLPKWPALVEAKRHREILNARFENELDQVVALSENEAEYWAEEEARLVNVAPEKRISSKVQLVTTRSGVLNRRLESEQQIYDNLITKLGEGNVSKGFERKRFDIVQPPNLAASPVGPNRKEIVSKYTLAGSALGIGFILLIGFLDPTVRTVLELETLTSLSVVGAMPTPARDKDAPNRLALNEDSDNHQSESVRTLRTGLTFLAEEKNGKTFLISSAESGEGKSWVASNLALSFAKQGERTLLIDADLRQSIQHEFFGYDKDSPGLTDHLGVRKPIKEIIQKSGASKKLYLFPAGTHVPNAAELLGGKRLPRLMERLEDYFDRIVIDSAPLVPVSDSIPLARLAGSVVLVCRMSKTPKGAIMRALRLLRENRTEPVGLVANGLPRPRTKVGYGYYYSYTGGVEYGYGPSSDSYREKG